jgi:hypothetical protein
MTIETSVDSGVQSPESVKVSSTEAKVRKSPANKGKKLFDPKVQIRGYKYSGHKKGIVMAQLLKHSKKDPVTKDVVVDRGIHTEIMNKYHVSYLTQVRWLRVALECWDFVKQPKVKAE